MKTVALPTENIFYNLNTVSGFAVGQTLSVTNNSSETIFLLQSLTQPSASTDSYPLYSGKSSLVSAIIPTWVMGSVGPIIVQTPDELICPSEMLNPRIMVGLDALTTQSFIEANCKNGVQYEVTTFDPALLSGGIRDFVVTTGSKPIVIKGRVFTFTGDQITTAVYKNPTYTGGTTVPYYNLSDINPVTGEAVLIGAPTVTAVGTQFGATYTHLGEIPQTGQAVSVVRAEGSFQGAERILAPNSVYLFRTTNTGALTSIFTSKNTWYEGDLSTGA
jgi:hypothetical protein